MGMTPPTETDPRTDADHNDDAAGQGISTPEPAEGADDADPGEQPGSPQG